jgi:hypothetical protein
MASHPEILEGFVDVPTFAEKVNSCPTVDRWTRNPDGLPYTEIGNARFNPRGDARQWLLNACSGPFPRTEIPSGNVDLKTSKPRRRPRL